MMLQVELTYFAPADIWIADGPTVEILGFAYPTRMVVIKLKESQASWIWSPIGITRTQDLANEVVKAAGPVQLHCQPQQDLLAVYPTMARTVP